MILSYQGDCAIQRTTSSTLTTGDTAIVLKVDTSGAQDFLVVGQVVGDWDNASEDIQVSASTEGNMDGIGIWDGSSTLALHYTYKNLAADRQRTVNGLGTTTYANPTGTNGPVLGMFEIHKVLYDLQERDSDGKVGLYKTTPAGYVEIDLGNEMTFTSGGITTPGVGDIMFGAISGASVRIDGIALEGGSWLAGDARGRFVFTTVSGTFQAENINIGANANVATVSGTVVDVTMEPGGRFETYISNFDGLAGTEKVYGADGVNQGWEFDPLNETFVRINTGLTNDRPTHVIEHKRHLFFSFDGNIQYSGIGVPHEFTVLSGANQLATGQLITGFKVESGSEQGGRSGALLVFNKNRSHVIYGSSSLDWDMIQYREEIGAYPYTIQEMANTMFLGDQGITDLETTQAFGNFKHNTYSSIVQSFMNERRGRATASIRSRDKSQYRIFFSDGWALYITMEGREVKGIMPVYFPVPVNVAISVERDDGTEAMYIGTTRSIGPAADIGGQTHKLDAGTSFDGLAIDGFLKFHFCNARSLRIIKKWLDCVLEVIGLGYAEFDLSYEIDSNDEFNIQPDNADTVKFNPTLRKWGKTPVLSDNTFTFGSGLGSDISWNDDGLKLFSIDVSADSIMEHDVTTSYNSSTASATADRSFTFAYSGMTTIVTHQWRSDGKMLWILDAADFIVQYTTLTAWLVTGLTEDTIAGSIKKLDLTSQTTDASAFCVTENGEHLYVATNTDGGTSNDFIYQYDILPASAYQLREATYNQSVTLTSGERGVTAIAISPDGKHVFHTSLEADLFSEGDLTAYDISTLIVRWHEISLSAYADDVLGMTFADSGTRLYMTQSTAATPVREWSCDAYSIGADNNQVWDDGTYWDGRKLTPVEQEIGGSSENISLTITRSSDEFARLRFTGALLRYTQRRRQR